MKFGLKTTVAPIALTLGMLGASSASAVTINTAQALLDFNAIIYQNASTTSDIEGAAVIGGNFNGATVFNNVHAPAAPSGFGALTVYGNTAGNPINLNNGGSAYVGGTKGAKINFNGGGAYISAPPATITDFETAFNGLSTSLSALKATSFLPTTGNNEVITATPGKNGVAVFDITAAQLDAIPSYSINLNGASSVIFNVTGDANFNGNLEGGPNAASKIIWNFYDANTVSLGTQFEGTVLAVHAGVTNANQIDGDLIANSFGGNGELHSFGFNGALISTAPEPATWAMMLVGFGGMGAALRGGRRRRMA